MAAAAADGHRAGHGSRGARRGARQGGGRRGGRRGGRQEELSAEGGYAAPSEDVRMTE